MQDAVGAVTGGTVMNFKKKTSRIFMVGLVSTTFCVSNILAQDFVYQPLNPSFGGSSFNSSHLLSIATIDRPDPPSSGGQFDEGNITQADLFAERLERAILGRLSNQITDAIFGEDADPNGEFEFGNTRVVFDTSLDGDIDLTIIDSLSQNETRIQVPGSLRGQ